MDAGIKIGMVLVVLLILTSAAFACNIAVGSLNVGLKSDYDNQFSSNISAPQNLGISIQMQFNVNSYSGTDCPANISANAIISRYNSDTSSWESYTTVAQKSQTLSNGAVLLTWTDAFNTGNNDKYTQYKVEGDVLQNDTVLDSQTAYVDVSNNSCSGIKLVVNDISVDEGTTSTRTFRLENNTDQSFNITNLDFSVTSSLIRSGNVDYDNYVPSHSSSTITLTLDSGFVSNNQVTTGRLFATGNLNGISCSQYDVGVQSFQITVRDTGINENPNYDYYNNNYDYYNNSYYDNYNYNNNYYPNGANSDCANLSLQTNDFSIDEGATQKIVFGLKNNSIMRFEIQEVSATSNGVVLSNFDNDKYTFSGQVGSIILNATAPNVVADKSYLNSVKVRGVFANGRTCAFSDLNQAFTATVINAPQSGALNCSAFGISAPVNSVISNFGTVPFTINNNTNRSVDVYVEGSVDATPTIISLPSNTTISRSLNVTMPQKSGYLTFRPVVDGCNLPVTTVNITNPQTGINASTTQASNQGNSSGLFTLGGAAESIGIVILIVIVVVLLVALVAGYGGKNDTDQAWVKK